MRFLSLFSGIEAASVAWTPLGWSAAAFAEIEPFPCAILAHHYPDVPNLGDVTGITEAQVKALGPIDVVCGGFPCQDLSVAGKRKGMRNADGSATRSGLFFDAIRIAEWSGARWVVLENVPGIFSSNAGRDFAAVVGEMAGTEFDVPPGGWRNAGVAAGPLGLIQWVTLDAQYVRVESHPRAVPQRRRRVFIVRHSGDWRSAPPLFLIPESLRGHPAPSRKAGQGVAPTVSARTKGGGGLGTDFDCDGGLIPEAAPTLDIRCGRSGETSFATSGGLIPEIVGQAMSAKWSKGTAGPAGDEHHNLIPVPDVTHALRADGFDASEDGTGRGTPLVPEPVFSIQGNLIGRDSGGPMGVGVGVGVGFTLTKNDVHAIAFDTTQITSEANRSNPQPGNACHTLANGAHAPAIAFDCMASGMNGFGIGEVANPQRVGTSSSGAAHQAVQIGWQVRRLMPIETERLMGFPDGYTAITYRGKSAADGPRYKAHGNSWAVNVAAWVGERIQAVDAIAEAA